MLDALFLPYQTTNLPTTPNPRKVSIIGTGQVGMAIAYAMVIQNCADEITLVDANEEKALGEAMDLHHGLSFVSPTKVCAGGLEDCKDSDVIVLTAGTKRKVGETRLELVGRNIGIFKNIIPPLAKVAPNAIFLVVSNPVDIMTYAAWRFSGLPASSVIGSGTILDTARFRALLSQKLELDPHNVHAYIIGEHGDSEVPVWSSLQVAGTPLQKAFPNMGTGNDPWTELFEKVKDAAQEVIRRKGATCYAIGLGTTRLVKAILSNQQHIFTTSCHIDGPYGISDVYLSLPAVIGRKGVERLVQLHLSPQEEKKLHHSSRVLREVIESQDFS
ncbi:MAG TPA: L-lactate dehydrogenase [Myxococcales bacterium]|nr:L-lactate dehydrogenase [Deltaproteobacteria bacterium]MBU52378.1 L-lactate dehydrogenase [Deltaproteobacteria bacterium]HAA56116.1 L-lactate dehydrogenase [Myxococcales bacterium]|tara:strand:- start:6080 stop:7069 length:990 start_codon:yes stop_codon:yes gene_type:complete